MSVKSRGFIYTIYLIYIVGKPHLGKLLSHLGAVLGDKVVPMVLIDKNAKNKLRRRKRQKRKGESHSS